MSLFAKIVNALNNRVTTSEKTIVKHIEEEFDAIREEFKKEVKRIEEKITGSTENPTLTGTESTLSASSTSGDDSVARENAAAALSTAE